MVASQAAACEWIIKQNLWKQNSESNKTQLSNLISFNIPLWQPGHHYKYKHMENDTNQKSDHTVTNTSYS